MSCAPPALNAIIGYSEMLQEEATERGQPDFVADLQKIHVAGRHLLTLINDVLDLSKIEAGKMEFTPETFDVREAVEAVVTTVRPLVEKNGNRPRGADRRERGDHARGPDPRAPGDPQSAVECRQVYRARPDHARRSSRERGRRANRRVPDQRYGHRDFAGRDVAAVPGVLTGRRDHCAPLRRHGAWPRHQPADLSADGG